MVKHIFDYYYYYGDSGIKFSLKKKKKKLPFTNRVDSAEALTDCSKDKFQIAINFLFLKRRKESNFKPCLFKTKCEVVNYVALLIIC